MNENNCRGWYEGDPLLEAYHDCEWCKENHDDQFQFEMLCLHMRTYDECLHRGDSRGGEK